MSRRTKPPSVIVWRSEWLTLRPWMRTRPLPEEFENEEALFDAIEPANEALWQLEEGDREGLQRLHRRAAPVRGCGGDLNWRESWTSSRAGAAAGHAQGGERRRSRADGPEIGEGGEADAPDEKPLSQALVSDLAAHRRQITKLALLKNPKLASRPVAFWPVCRCSQPGAGKAGFTAMPVTARVPVILSVGIPRKARRRRPAHRAGGLNTAGWLKTMKQRGW